MKRTLTASWMVRLGIAAALVAIGLSGPTRSSGYGILDLYRETWRGRLGGRHRDGRESQARR
jgi:hypothetical protein